MGWFNSIFNIKSTIKEEGLNKKVLIAFFFMSLVPILLSLYIIYFAIPGIKEDTMGYLRLVITWMVAIALAGYGIIKTTVSSINRMVRDARAIASGDLTKRVETGEKN